MSSTSSVSTSLFSTALVPLVEALQQTGKPVCIDRAASLMRATGRDPSYSLHLRYADLSSSDAQAIAAALEHVHSTPELRLISFSVSYNKAIGFTGANALLKALPQDLVELGMVGANLDDASGESIKNFLASAHGLRMVCVEHNHFCAEMKKQIRQAASKGSGCTVIV